MAQRRRPGDHPRVYFIRLAPDSGEAPIVSRQIYFNTAWMASDTGWTGPRPILFDTLVDADHQLPPLFRAAIRGCATVRVRIFQNGGAEAGIVPGPACGSLVPTLVGMPAFDRENRVVSVSLVLTNEWTRELVRPARILLWSDSNRVTRPLPPPPQPRMSAPGRRPPPPPPRPVVRVHLAPQSPDFRVHVLAPDSAIGPGALVWAAAEMSTIRFRAAGRGWPSHTCNGDDESRTQGELQAPWPSRPGIHIPYARGR